MPDLHSASDPRLQSLLNSLARVRQLLLHSPSSLSLETAGLDLAQIEEGISTLPSYLSPPLSQPDRQALLQIQSLAQTVHALYRNASLFFQGLATESIQNGAWDAAAYSSQGDWLQPNSAATNSRWSAEA
jgi:hypothetical protein